MARNERIELPAEFDALLRDAMTVEPSAGFLPRVRQRVAHEEPRVARWRFGLLVGGAAVAAACMLAVSLVPRDWGSMPAAPAPPVLQAVQQVPVGPPDAVEAPRNVPAVARVRAPVHRSVQAEPAAEVIVDARQHAALATMMRLITEGKLTEDSFARTTPPSSASIRDRVVPVGVAPVAVSPVGADGVLPKDTERK